MRVFVTAKPPPRRRAAPRWLCVAALALAVLWALQDALQPQAAALLVAGSPPRTPPPTAGAPCARVAPTAGAGFDDGGPLPMAAAWAAFFCPASAGPGPDGLHRGEVLVRKSAAHCTGEPPGRAAVGLGGHHGGAAGGRGAGRAESGL